MGELDDSQQARLFDALLSDAEKWHTPPHAQARRAAQADVDVAEDLSLVAALSEVKPPRAETEFARSRVAQRLAAMMREEPGPVIAPQPKTAHAWLRAVTAPPAQAAQRIAATRRSAQPRHTWRESAAAESGRVGAPLRRLALIAVALLILTFGTLAGASAASAQALPESPLYAVKRAEESTLLALAWTDDSKGQTLAMIASHRLIEANAEANQRRTAEATTLLSQFDTTFTQLIDLTAHAQAIHENTSNLTRAVQTTLELEQNVAAQAALHGESAFAAAANASAEAANAHIQQAGVEMPGKSGQSNDASHGSNAGAHSSNGSGAGGDSGGNSGGNSGDNSGGNSGGKPQQTPIPHATHTPRASQGSAQPTATPTATPTADATSTPDGG